MKSKIPVLCLFSVLLLFGLSVPGMSQQHTSTATPPVDSADIAINYKTAYPGSETWIEVQMKNPMDVWGYQLIFAVTIPEDVWWPPAGYSMAARVPTGVSTSGGMVTSRFRRLPTTRRFSGSVPAPAACLTHQLIATRLSICSRAS